VSKKKVKKPAPINTKLHRAPKAAPKEPVAQGINAVSPITEAQMRRAEKAIDTLRSEVKELRATPPAISVKSEAPTVTIPPRPRITKVKIKYDQLGYPSELIPQYSEPAG
jgi:hypothetical protein